MAEEPTKFQIREIPRHIKAISVSVLRAFGLLWETSPGLSIALGLLTLLGGVLPGLMAVVAKSIVDGVMHAVETGAAADRQAVLRWIAVEAGLVVGASAMGRGSDVSHALLRVLLGQRVNERILEKALTLTLADFENSEFHDRMNRARNGASYRPLSVVMGIFGLFRSAIALVTYGAILWGVSRTMVLAITVAAIAEFIVETRFSSDAFRLFRWRSTDSRRQNYLDAVLSRDDHAKEVKLFNLGPMLLGRYREIFARFWQEDRALTLRRSAWGFALGLASTAVYYGSYAWIALKAMRRAITIGDLSMYVMVFRQGQGAMSNVLDAVGSLYDDHLYLATLFEYLDHPTSEASTTGVTVGTDPRDGFRFENVSFTYPGAQRPVLSDVSLHLPAGRKLALVGENGAGKTTLIKLLTRLYAPTSGRILLDGVDIQDWNLDALRRRIGVIFQDFVRYQFSVGENIGAGDVTAFDDEARWKVAAERGTADEFIDKLPSGYRTQLGKWFDDGQDLSVGQWQKIALSRAFMRTSADILILDEPTASIDAAAEARVFERFQALAADRTAVLISHRFSTVRMADVIAVLADGKIVEQGSHDELLARGGRYAELFFLQAKGYR